MTATSLGNVAIIPSRAALRGLSASGLPPVIFLQGTTTPLDGGQGFYGVNLIDKTTADNGGSVLVDGGGYRWELVSEDTATQIVASLSNNGVRPALDPILNGVTSLAAAATTDLSAITQVAATVTGNGVSISSFGALSAGPIRFVTFADVNTLVYNATSMILPGAANIVTAAGDIAGFISLGSGNWQCLFYSEASGGTPGTLPISEGGTGKTTSVTAFDALAALGANIASATTTDIGAATGPVINVTGAVTITGLGTKTAGVLRWVKFTGAPLLTYNASSLILPGAANIQAAANDAALFQSLGSGNWICLFYQPASALPIVTVPVNKGGTNAITTVGGYDSLTTQGGDIASASTTDLSAATGPFLNVTGAVTITALGTAAAGITRVVKFTGAPLLTHNGTSLILPGSANIQAAANDVATFRSLGSGNWICIQYQKASGLLLPAAFASTAQAADITDTTHGLTPSSLIAAAAGVPRLLFFKTGADLNVTTDQTLTKQGTFTNYRITTIAVTNTSATAGIAAGGFYTGAGKTGVIIVAAAQTYPMTASNQGNNCAAAVGGLGILSATPIFSLTTAAGSACTADIYFIGVAFS